MKQFLPVLFLLFICSLCLNNPAAAQDSAVTKAKVDTVEEEWDSFDGFFPGGDSAWKKYIDEHLVYPKKAKRKKIHGVVVVQFIVDKEGYISDVEALTGPEILRQSAVAVVKKSPKWLPRSERKSQGNPPSRCDIIFKLDKK